MRGVDVQLLGIFSCISVKDRVPKDHLIRKSRMLVDTILGEFDEFLNRGMRSDGRMSIPPESDC